VKTGRWIVGAAVIAAIVAVVATCGHDDAPLPATPADGPSTKSPEPREGANPKVPRTSRVAPSDGTTETPPDTAAGPKIVEFPALDVEVTHADGKAAPHAYVYVMPPGAAGPSDEPGAAKLGAMTGDDGRCRVLLPRRGSVDVGAVVGPESVVVPDVVVPRETLRIVLPRLEETLFVATPAAAERMRRHGATVWLRRPGSGPWHKFPGRADRLGSWFAPEFLADSLTNRVSVPSDLDWFVAASPDLRATPTTLRAPARVELDATDAVCLTVGVTLAPAEGVPSPIGGLRVDFETVPVVEQGEPSVETFVRPRPSGGHQRMQARIWLPRSGGTLRWHGAGVRPGERALSAAETGSAAPVEVVVQFDGSPLANGPLSAMLVVAVRGVRARANAAKCFLPSDRGVHADGDVRSDGSCRVLGDLPAWLGASQDDWSAAPVRVTDAASAPRELTLAPGGFLTIECDPKPPESLGALTLSRKDGTPVYWHNSALLPSIDAITGNKIGPLPPGEHTFVLRLAGFDVGEVTATVVAGETTNLVVPHLPPR
jgi:hypothetical protein